MRILFLLLLSCTATSSTSQPLCEPIAATLDLSPPFTASALDGLVLRARKPGPSGNLIGVAFLDDAVSPEGYLAEDPHRGRVFVHYQPAYFDPWYGYTAGSRTRDVIALVSGSALIEPVGGLYPDAELQEDEDAFALTLLTGGGCQ